MVENGLPHRARGLRALRSTCHCPARLQDHTFPAGPRLGRCPQLVPDTPGASTLSSVQGHEEHSKGRDRLGSTTAVPCGELAKVDK